VVLAAVLDEVWFADLCRHLIQPDLSLVLRAGARAGRDRLRARPGEADVDFSKTEYEELQDLLLRLAGDNGMIPVDSGGSPDETVAACLPHLHRLGLAPLGERV
jgi:dTMP kinase